MKNDHRRLVLVVDTDQGFVDDARSLLAAHRVLAARDLDEAREIVLGGRVDLVILGPAFGSDFAIDQARDLHAADSSVQLVLAADVVTNRLLKAALRGGFVDVLDTPLTERDLADLFPQTPASEQDPVEIRFEIDPTTWKESARAPVAEDRESVAMAQPLAAAAAEAAVSVASPTEATFYVETVPFADDAEPSAQPTPAATAASLQPEPECRDVTEAPELDPHLDDPPTWPSEDSISAVATRATDEVLSWELPSSPIAAHPVLAQPVAAQPASAQPVAETVPAESETSITPASLSDDFLNRVMPPPRPVTPPPAAPPVTAAADEAASPGHGRVIAVMAGKGGSGKTVTTTNLALAIGQRHDPERVVIVDADLQFGDVALMLRIDPIRTLDDVVDRMDQMTDDRLKASLVRHESGVRVLPAPVLPIRSGEIDAKSIVEVVERLRSMFDTVIVDTGPVFDDGLVTILEQADQVVAVVDMDLPSAKNAKITLGGLRQIGFDMSRIRLVVNRFNSKARLDVSKLERTLGLDVSGSIPSDRLVPQSVNVGVPVLALSPRSKVARAYRTLAETLDLESEEHLGAR